MRTLLYTPTPSAKAKSLQRVFQHCGIHTDTCDKADRFLYLSMTERYAAVVVYEPLPRGEELLPLFAKWKQAGCTSLFVVLTSVQSAFRRGKALEAGIDRYYIEPFSHTELVKEISLHGYALAGTERNVHATKHFEVDILRRTVSFTGRQIDLTKTEFDILALLIRRQGAVLSRVQIWEEIWGYEEYPLANTIDVHINRLRRKLPADAKRYLNTVYGVGYRVNAEA